jgi:hypothetical protein
MKSIYTYIALALVAGTICFSQTEPTKSGTIIGKVMHAVTNEPLVGANVLVVGTTYGAATDIDGRFIIGAVPLGTYAVRASLIGFQSVVKTDVMVNPVRAVDLSFSLAETILQIGEVSVTAEYFAKSPEFLLSTQTQSAQEIRRLPGGFEDVVRAISILPGVAQVQPGRNDLIVRGGAPSENLFVVENIEVPNINHYGTQGASGGPLSYINLDFVEGTSFSSGGFGVRYGDKLSSVLNINLRNGRDDRIGGKLLISGTQFGLNLEGPLASRGSFLLSARRSYLDFIFKAAGFAFVPEYWDFLAKGSYSLGKTDELSLVSIGAIDNIRLFNETPEKRYDNSRILLSNQNQFLGGLSWRHLFGSGYSTLTFGQSYIEYDTRQNDTVLQPIFTNRSIEHESSLRADLVFQLSKSTEFAVGLQAKAVRFFSRMYVAPFWTNYGLRISVNRELDTLAWKSAGYAQLTQQFGPLRVVAGGRFDYFNLIEKHFVAAPRLSASMRVSEKTTINASVGRYCQAPSYVWLVSNPSNRRLSHIAVNQFVLGVEHLPWSDTRLSVEGYLKKYSDYPASVNQPFLVLANSGAGYGGSQEAFASFGVDPLTSAGRGEAHGVELFAQKRFSEIPCYGTVSVSYNESRFAGLDGIERPSSFDQRWILNLGGGYVFDERWEISAKFRLATGRPYTPYNSNGTQSASRYNSERAETNHSLDLRIDRRWMFDNWMLAVFVDVQNVYNRKQRDVPRYNERIGATEQPDAIGILPTIGVSAEF